MERFSEFRPVFKPTIICQLAVMLRHMSRDINKASSAFNFSEWTGTQDFCAAQWKEIWLQGHPNEWTNKLKESKRSVI